uniref:Uncharacterized protein n=1 Tax=Fagus sylvatica TaxID=28930 RepID=A0A2N9IY21_FAGSY
MLARGEGGRSLTGAWGRVRPPMEAFPPPNGGSSFVEFGRGAIFTNRSWEAPVLGFERCGGAGAREHRLPTLSPARGGALFLRWRFFHRTTIDLEAIYPLVVVSVRVDAWNDDFGDRGGSAARGGAWATKPRTPVARESAWSLQ